MIRGMKVSKPIPDPDPAGAPAIENAELNKLNKVILQINKRNIYTL